MDNIQQMGMFNVGDNDDSVDKLVDKQKKEVTYKGMKPTNKVTVLTVPVDKSFMEGNLIEIPFISYFKTKTPITTVEYVWTDSKGIERKIEVRSSKWGTPDEYCFDVLIALFKLHIKQNQGIQYNLEEKRWDMSKIIHFTLTELAKEMGYKSIGKNIYNKIDIALEILNDTTIYNTNTGGFLDIKANEYLTGEMKESIKILRDYKSYRYSKLAKGQKRLDYTKIKEKTSIVIDDFIYESLCNSYFKYFDYDKYLNLKMGIAKKIFLLLNKWRAKREKVFLKWSTLYERIPLISSIKEYNKPEKYMKKRIRDACKQLIEVGYIKEVHDTTIGVEFIFDNNKNELVIDKGKEDKYDNIQSIINALNGMNLSEIEIIKVLSEIETDKIKTFLNNTESMENDMKKNMILSLLTL